MIPSSAEWQRPTEWLRGFLEDESAYQRLVAESAGFAAAAYRLARARCRAGAVSSGVPNLQELQAAALTLARHLESPQPLPTLSLLASECEQGGMPVIGATEDPRSAKHSRSFRR